MNPLKRESGQTGGGVTSNPYWMVPSFEGKYTPEYSQCMDNDKGPKGAVDLFCLPREMWLKALREDTRYVEIKDLTDVAPTYNDDYGNDDIGDATNGLKNTFSVFFQLQKGQNANDVRKFIDENGIDDNWSWSCLDVDGEAPGGGDSEQCYSAEPSTWHNSFPIVYTFTKELPGNVYFEVGEEVERRWWGDLSWEAGYVTSLNPLQVTWTHDPNDGATEWAHVRKLPTVSKCADEGGQCSCTGQVYYGKRFEHQRFRNTQPSNKKATTFDGLKKHGHYMRVVTGSMPCTSEAFGGGNTYKGDPLPGFWKHCYCEEMTPQATGGY